MLGKVYDARFSHIAGYNACNNCHNPHSLQVDIRKCNTCHTGVTDFKDIRYVGSQTDYDGSGDLANATQMGWGSRMLYKFWPF